MPFKNKEKFIRKVRKDAFDKLVSESPKFENQGTRLVKTAVANLSVIDSGFLQRNTFCKTFVGFNTIIVSMRTEGVPYAPYPYHGLSTSAGYGARRWLELGMKYFCFENGIKPKQSRS